MGDERRRLVLAHVVSCCVYEMPKQSIQFVKGNDQICLTIGQVQALISVKVLKSSVMELFSIRR